MSNVNKNINKKLNTDNKNTKVKNRASKSAISYTERHLHSPTLTVTKTDLSLFSIEMYHLLT